jgi:hypothetical protein
MAIDNRIGEFATEAVISIRINSHTTGVGRTGERFVEKLTSETDKEGNRETFGDHV